MLRKKNWEKLLDVVDNQGDPQVKRALRDASLRVIKTASSHATDAQKVKMRSAANKHQAACIV